VRISFCTSEVAPFSKTGGLADVADGLPRALARLGEDVTVISPWYRCVREWFGENPAVFETSDLDPFVVRETVLDDVRLVFVVADELYDRPRLYLDANGHDQSDNLLRFAHLCRAARGWVARQSPRPDVMHVNDWQTALLPIFEHAENGKSGMPTVLTIHNAAYQGTFPPSGLEQLGLGGEYFTSESLEFYGQINLLKGGIVFADTVTTVSPSYAGEIQTEAQGCGLDGVFRAHRDKLTGVLNGIDASRWDPRTDAFLRANFDPDDLTGKASCKAALQAELELPVRPEAFLIGSVGRLDRQKGIDLLIGALTRLDDLTLQIAFLGSGDSALERQLRTLAAAQPARVACRIGFDEPLAHRIEAGADAFVMPSLYEPCGLNQMYSQRYGTVPIVRATGGLADTVEAADATARAAGRGSGFVFTDASADALAATVREAASVFFELPDEWLELAARIMRIDHSWAGPARAYQDIYTRLLVARDIATGARHE
jgi:starch synthase